MTETMIAPLSALRKSALRRWVSDPMDEKTPIPCQRASYSIGGKPVAYEEWTNTDIAHHCRTADALTPQDLRGPDKEVTGAEGWWIVPLFILSLAGLIGLWVLS